MIYKRRQKTFQDRLLSPVSYVISNKQKQAKLISNLDSQPARNDARLSGMMYELYKTRNESRT